MREETALIRTKKQKVDLEILKLKLELASMQSMKMRCKLRIIIDNKLSGVVI